MYLRYNPADGNSERVVDQLDRLWNMGNCVIFMSYGERPLMAATETEFRDVKNKVMSMQSEISYSGQSELEYFDSCFVSFFMESVNSNLSIVGLYDKGNGKVSHCVFMVSERMFNDLEVSEFLEELVAVNDLDKRMNVSVYTYNDVAVTKRNSFANKGKIKYNKK